MKYPGDEHKKSAPKFRVGDVCRHLDTEVEDTIDRIDPMTHCSHGCSQHLWFQRERVRCEDFVTLLRRPVQVGDVLRVPDHWFVDNELRTVEAIHPSGVVVSQYGDLCEIELLASRGFTHADGTPIEPPRSAPIDPPQAAKPSEKWWPHVGYASRPPALKPLARALFDTDPEVTEYVRTRADSSDLRAAADTCWRINDRGFRERCEHRAKAMLEAWRP
jgi:hypothetical protein